MSDAAVMLFGRLCCMPGFKLEAKGETDLTFTANGISFCPGSWLSFEHQIIEAYAFFRGKELLSGL